MLYFIIIKLLNTANYSFLANYSFFLYVFITIIDESDWQQECVQELLRVIWAELFELIPNASQYSSRKDVQIKAALSAEMDRVNDLARLWTLVSAEMHLDLTNE